MLMRSRVPESWLERADIVFYTAGVPPKQQIKVSVPEIGKWLASNKKPEYEVV